MKKALYIVTSMDTGGAETVFMKYYRALDKSRYQLDFCVSSDVPGFLRRRNRVDGRQNCAHSQEDRGRAGRFVQAAHADSPGRRLLLCCQVVSAQSFLS